MLINIVNGCIIQMVSPARMQFLLRRSRLFTIYLLEPLLNLIIFAPLRFAPLIIFIVAPLSQRHFPVFISRHYWRSICCIYKGLLLSVRKVKIWIRNRFNYILDLYLGLFGHYYLCRY